MNAQNANAACGRLDQFVGACWPRLHPNVAMAGPVLAPRESARALRLAASARDELAATPKSAFDWRFAFRTSEHLAHKDRCDSLSYSR